MGYIADRIRSESGRHEEYRNYAPQREEAPAPAQQQDTSMWQDVKSFFSGIDDYLTRATLEKADYLRDENRNITPDSIAEAEAPMQTAYEPVQPRINGAYDYANAPEADNLLGHLHQDIKDWSAEANAAISAAYEDPSKDSLWNAYEKAIAAPAMGVAATPGAPFPLRAGAALAAAPSFVSGALNAASEGYDDGGIIGGAAGVGNALIAEPLGQLAGAAMHPADTLESIYEHPLNLWTDVLEPGMVAEMGARGGKKIYDHRGEIKDFAMDSYNQGAANAVYDRTAGRQLDRMADSYAHGPENADMSDFYAPAEPDPAPGGDYYSYIDQVADAYGVDRTLAHQVAEQESAHGQADSNIFQVIDSTAEELGFSDVSDPYQSIEAGIKYLSQKLRENDGDVESSLRAYNGGGDPEYVQHVLSHKGFESAAADPGAWEIAEAQYLGQSMPSGPNGCVEAVVRLGENNEFLGRHAEEARVPNLVEAAKGEGRYMDFDPASLEKGDVIVYGDRDHVVMYDGEGGYIGNSTSQGKVVHGSDYRAMGGLQPTGIIKVGRAGGKGKAPAKAPDASRAAEEQMAAEANSHAFDELNEGIDDYMAEDYEPVRMDEAKAEDPDGFFDMLEDERPKAKADEPAEMMQDDIEALFDELDREAMPKEEPKLEEPKAEEKTLTERLDNNWDEPRFEGKTLDEIYRMPEEERELFTQLPDFDAWLDRALDEIDRHEAEKIESSRVSETDPLPRPEEPKAEPHEPTFDGRTLDELQDLPAEEYRRIRWTPEYRAWEQHYDEYAERLANGETVEGAHAGKVDLQRRQPLYDLSPEARQLIDEADASDTVLSSSLSEADRAVLRHQNFIKEDAGSGAEIIDMANLKRRLTPRSERQAQTGAVTMDQGMQADIDKLMQIDSMDDFFSALDEMQAPTNSTTASPSPASHPQPQTAPASSPPPHPASASSAHGAAAGSNAFPAYRSGRNLDGQRVSKQDILERAEELFMPVYSGFLGHAMRGLRRSVSGEVRTSRWGDIPEMARQIGSLVHSRLNIPAKNRWFRNEFDAALKKLHPGETIEPKFRSSTAISDFMQQYLTDEKAAQQNFPYYYKAFSKALKDPANADIHERISSLKDFIMQYQQQSPTSRFSSTITYGQRQPNRTLRERVQDGLDRLNRKWFDDISHLKDIDRIREEIKGRALSTRESIYKMARLSRGWASSLTELFVTGRSGKIVVDAINEALGSKVLSDAKTMQQTLEAVSRIMRTDEGKAFMRDGKFEDPAQALDALLAARRFVEMQQLDLQHLREYRDLLRSLIERGKAAEASDGRRIVYANRDFDAIKDGIEKNLGREYRQMFEDSLKLQSGTHRGRAIESISPADDLSATDFFASTKLEGINPTYFVSAERILSNMIDAIDDWEKRYAKDYAAPGDIRDAQTVIDSAPKALLDSCEDIYAYNDNLLKIQLDAGLISQESYGLMQMYKSYVPLVTDFLTDGCRKMFGENESFINVGDEIKSQVAKDTNEKYLPIRSPLASIVDHTQKVLDSAIRNKIGQLLVEDVGAKDSARLVTEVRGSADPHKSSFHVWIDGEKHTYQTTPSIYSALETCGDVPTATFAWRFLRAGSQITRAANVTTPAFALANGIRDILQMAPFRTQNTWADALDPRKPGYARAVGHMLNQLMTGKDRIWNEYLATGASNSTISEFGRDAVHNKIRELSGMKGIRYRASKAWDAMLAVGSAMEALPRLREYMIVRSKGGSFEDAAFAARNITIDFSRAGEYGRNINQVSAFFNAALQGEKIFFQETLLDGLKDPKRGKRLMADFAPFLVSAMAYWGLSRSQGWYDDRPDWEKQGYWLLPDPAGLTKDGIIRLPKSQEAGILANVLEGTLDMALGKKKPEDILPGFAKATFDTLLPSLLSNAWVMPLEIASDHSFFTGSSITPSRLSRLPKAEQKTDRTTVLGEAVSSATGNRLSPIQSDHLGNGLAGGWYRSAGNALDAAAGKDRTAGDVTGFSRFRANETNSKALNDFYARRDELQKKYNAISLDSWETGRDKNAKAQKQKNLGKMDPVDRHNLQQIEKAQKAMNKISEKERRGAMSHEDAQRAKVQIAKAVSWRYSNLQKY